MKAVARRGTRVALGAVVLVGALAVLRPWTIRPIDRSQPGVFDAAAYVAKAWARVLAEAERTAVDIGAVRSTPAARDGGPAPSRRSVFVKATGVVTEVDRRSRVGVAYLTSSDGTSPARIAAQVGPVLRGTAIRDAAGFIHFTDFANQSEFAAVASALNDRVLRDVLSGLDVDSLPGRTLTVIGAASLVDGAGGPPVDLVPVKVLVEGGGR
jgi:predicted lipoprotein